MKPTCFVLVHKRNDDYRALQEEYDVKFLFEEVDSIPADIAMYLRRIDEVLLQDEFTALIVFNGPSWLIALAGFVWYSEQNRKHHNVLQYSAAQGKYVKIEGEIDDY